MAKRTCLAALALTLLPLAVQAGPDGRRLTLGTNRGTVEPAPTFMSPHNLVTPPNVALPNDQMASSSTTSPRSFEPIASPPAATDAPPIRVAPAADATPKVTPDYKSAAASAASPTRIERVRHEPASRDATRAVKVTAPHTKVTVKTTSETKRVRVSAPGTTVAVKDHKVRVDAPYTRVAVDEGRVRVRAPFVNLDIRW